MKVLTLKEAASQLIKPNNIINSNSSPINPTKVPSMLAIVKLLLNLIFKLQLLMNLGEDDIETCQKAFSDLDEDGLGAIRAQDLKIALERIGFNPSENDLYKMISEVDEHNTGLIKFSDFLTIYHKHKYANIEDDDQDTVDAFVAMGGNADKTGKVDADMLIKVIKTEFELTIDIESLIREIDKDHSGEIEFDEFKMLLKTAYSNDM